MAVGKLKAQWDIGAALWSVIANANRDSKKHPKAIHPAEIHPFRDKSDYEIEEKDKYYHHNRRMQLALAAGVRIPGVNDGES